MKIKIFMASAANMDERDILLNFGKGVQSWVDSKVSEENLYKDIVRIGRWNNFNLNNVTLDYEYSESYQHCDIAIIFGSWKPREKGTHQCRSSVALSGRPFFVIETPLLTRKTSSKNNYWRIGYGGFLNRDAHWPELDSANASQRLIDMGVSWQGWKNNQDGHILLALQLPGDASLRGVDINEWAFNAVLKIRSVTNKQIIIRNHPLCSQRAFADHEELARKILLAGVNNIKFSDGQIVPWENDLANAYCTVTYTSGLAIDSIVSGIPTVACDVGNFAWGISTQHVTNVNDLYYADQNEITQWLHLLAGAQWSTEEMANGKAWEYLLPVYDVNKPKEGKK